MDTRCASNFLHAVFVCKKKKIIKLVHNSTFGSDKHRRLHTPLPKDGERVLALSFCSQLLRRLFSWDGCFFFFSRKEIRYKTCISWSAQVCQKWCETEWTFSSLYEPTFAVNQGERLPLNTSFDCFTPLCLDFYFIRLFSAHDFRTKSSFIAKSGPNVYVGSFARHLSRARACVDAPETAERYVFPPCCRYGARCSEGVYTRV